MRISDWSSDVCSSDLAVVTTSHRQSQGVVSGGEQQRCEAGGGGGFVEQQCDRDDGLVDGREHLDGVCELICQRAARASRRWQDRKSVVSGKSVSVRVYLGGRRIIKQKEKMRQN